MSKQDDLVRLLQECSKEERLEIFNYLRRSIVIHPLEVTFNARAELILEAIARSNDITQRGIRGIIAEVAFLEQIMKELQGWKVLEVVGDLPYDFLIEDHLSAVKIQVKMQRKTEGKPLVRRGKFVVEVQRTRSGRDAVTGEPTRPYRFGAFDILAVSMQPSTRDWATFMYTVGNWLRPRRASPGLIEVMQPVATQQDDDWCADLNTAIARFRSGTTKTIRPF